MIFQKNIIIDIIFTVLNIDFCFIGFLKSIEFQSKKRLDIKGCCFNELNLEGWSLRY